MSITSTKKQNRVLLILMIVTLTAAAILIAVTGSANRKAKEEMPPVDSKVAEKESQPAPGPQKSLTENKLPETEDGKTAAGTAEETLTESITPKKDDKPEEDAAAEANDSIAVSAEVLPTFTAPVNGVVIKGFSDDIPVFSATMNDYRTHDGVDIACSVGSPVFSAAEGTVEEVSYDPMMGVTVAVSHSGNAVTRYCGLNENSMDLVAVGEYVACGQLLGASGDTALIESGEEDHLHFELTVGGESEDPAEFMHLTFLSDLTED